MDFTIRPYRADDEAAVIALWHACGLVVPWNDPRRDIETKVRFQPELLLVGIGDDRVVGSVMAGYDGHRGWINYLAVSPPLQRRGYGRQLLEEAEKRLRALGCPKVNLQIRNANRSVIAFYRVLGYELSDVVTMGKIVRGSEE